MLTHEQTLHLIDRIGILPPHEALAVLEQSSEDLRPIDCEAAARLLIERRVLTEFQWQEISAGRGSDLDLGEFVLIEPLGAGRSGTVYRARHKRSRQLFALKVLNASVFDSPGIVQRLYDGVEAAARLDHPHLVTACHVSNSGGKCFLVMPYIDGEDLSTLVRHHGPLEPDLALACVLQAARGLAYAHEHGIIHRNLKPTNLILDDLGTVKILDLGQTRLDQAVANERRRQPSLLSSDAGELIAAVDCVAPEQLLNPRLADGRSDLYSLGVIFRFLLTGDVDYARNEITPRLSESCPGVPAVVDRLVQRMVARSPDDRFPSMNELIEACEAAQASLADPQDPLAVRNEVDAAQAGLGESRGPHTSPTWLGQFRDWLFGVRRG